MSKSEIEWTDETWNVTTGCTRASAGCDNCYAVAMTKRLANIEATKDKYSGLVNEGKNHFNGMVKIHEDELEKPLHWKKPRKVFVNSMSDLFHPEVPIDFIDKVFAVIALTPQHTYQVLTKRPERMAKYLNKGLGEDWKSILAARYRTWKSIKSGAVQKNPDNCLGIIEKTKWPLPNVWLGTSVENQEAADERIPHLLKCPAAVRFLSCEPLLGQVDLSDITFQGQFYNPLNGQADIHPVTRNPQLDWVIVGGESGHNARPMHPDWVRSLRDQCKEAGVPFFFKQWGNWAPGSNNGKDEKIILKDGSLYRNPAPRNHVMMCYSESEWNDQEPNVIHKASKKESGRLLDGKEHNEFPESNTPHPITRNQKK